MAPRSVNPNQKIQEIRKALSCALEGSHGVDWPEFEEEAWEGLVKDIRQLAERSQPKPSPRPKVDISEGVTQVLATLPMEVVIFDPDFKYLYVNPAAVADTEIRRWLVGKDDFEYCRYRGKDLRIAEERQHLLQEAILRRSPQPLYQKMTSPSGLEKHYMRSVHPVFEADGQVLCLIGCSYEITDLKEKEQELLEINDQLMKATQELDQFVYRASHDLRSPLVSIMGLVNLIQLEDPEPAIQNYLNMVRRSIVKLDSFIREIVNHSKNARQDVELQLIDPDQEIREAIDELHYLREDKEFDIQVEVQNHAPWVSDPFRAHVVLKNLISNAMKYQNPELEGPGKIFIKVLIEPQETLIVVEDNGIGIPPEFQKDVFKMFFRATNLSFGAGIGLYIVKEALNRVNGSIFLESNPGEGSRFTVRLPNFMVGQLAVSS